MERNAMIGSRYQIVKRLGSGFAAEIYRVKDTESGRTLALKLYCKETPFPEYIEHLRYVQQSLASFHLHYLLQPLDTGVHEGRFWEVFEYLEASTPLDSLISAKGPLWPRVALDVLAKIASALVQVHKLDIIHADIKPSNILIDSTGEPCLIDFGLAQRVGDTGDVIIIGTFRYLHPHLRRNVTSMTDTRLTRLHSRGSIGPYLDIYALGLVTLEMLTRENTEPHPLSTDRVITLLLANNPALHTNGTIVVERLARLICRMLSSSSSNEQINAAEIAATATSLRDAFASQRVEALESGPLTRAEPSAPSSQVAALAAAVDSLRQVAETLAASTVAMVRTAERLEEVGSADNDSQLLSDMKNAFDHASGRVRTSWRIGMGMTLCAFVLTITMILAAIVFGIRTGASGWTLTFGGVGAASILGTLLWRPYDRAFRATILAQQIEMIHVQTIATFRGTTDLNKRIEICREAIYSLRVALETHAIAEDSMSKAGAKRTQSRKDARVD